MTRDHHHQKINITNIAYRIVPDSKNADLMVIMKIIISKYSKYNKYVPHPAQNLGVFPFYISKMYLVERVRMINFS